MKKTSKELFESVWSGTSKKESVLIENSKRGTNYEVYDLFHEYKEVYAIGEEIKKNDADNSYDRFLVISKKDILQKEANKSSMMFVVSHKPGSLYRAIAIFENYELNLTKIESRRMYGESSEYMFYVDFEYSKKHQSRIDEIIAVYKENTEYLRIIGFYQTTKL